MPTRNKAASATETNSFKASDTVIVGFKKRQFNIEFEVKVDGKTYFSNRYSDDARADIIESLKRNGCPSKLPDHLYADVANASAGEKPLYVTVDGQKVLKMYVFIDSVSSTDVSLLDDHIRDIDASREAVRRKKALSDPNSEFMKHVNYLIKKG